MKKISEEEALLFGIDTKYDLMDNGERKFRLNCLTDGSSYCRTVASKDGAWQNSHYHEFVSEIYVIQSGWIVYVQKDENELKMCLLREGESVTFLPYVHHNIYLSAESVIHTIKYGTARGTDWIASPELDMLTKHLCPNSLFSQ